MYVCDFFMVKYEKNFVELYVLMIIEYGYIGNREYNLFRIYCRVENFIKFVILFGNL